MMHDKIYNYKNTRLKLQKTNAAIWLNEICKTVQLMPKYFSIKINGNNTQNNLHRASVKHLNCKLYYQQLHLKYLCNLARY
jgi:hypothetical protein